MADSAVLKIKRAKGRIAELGELLKQKRPFRYFVETNTKSGERAMLAKGNSAVLADIALICGEVVHGLRSALDNAYWDIVSPFAKTERERKSIQFPFCADAARLEETARSRLADRVSPKFLKAVLDLKPHGGAGGNGVLYLVEELDIADKHKHLILMTDYKTLSTKAVRQEVPDIPVQLTNVAMSGARKDIVWTVNPATLKIAELGNIRPPTLYTFEKELNVSVDVVLTTGLGLPVWPLVPTLQQLADATKAAVSTIRESAK